MPNIRSAKNTKEIPWRYHVSRESLKDRTLPNKKALDGAGEEVRTLDIHLGKVTLYQLSYFRLSNYNGAETQN